jgi:N-acetylneuraminic acid mutarotase
VRRKPATPKPTPAQRAHAQAVRLARRLPVTLASAALLQHGSSIYVVGGNVHGKPVDSIWRIDLVHSRVDEVGRFIEPLAGAASAVHAGALYLAGGWTGQKLATAVLRWTPGSDAALVTRLPVGVRGARGAFVGSTLYVVGGSSGATYAVDVDAGSVSAVTSTPKAAAAISNVDIIARALLRRAG